MPSKYLLHINSRPQTDAGINEEDWVKWYTNELLPDSVNGTTANRVTLYRERHDFPLAAKEPSPRNYLALYETDLQDAQQPEELKEKGDSEVRNYKLIQHYDPLNIGTITAPVVATVEIEPTEENVQDVDDWYRQEHLEMLAKLSGYRGGIRYVCMNGARTTAGGPPLYLAAHFVDHINSFSGTDYDALLETPWTLKHLKESKSAIMRFWDKVADYGH